MRQFTIGKIVNTQGIKGEVRVLPMTYDIERFKLLKNIEIFKKNDKKTMEIQTVKFHKHFVLIKFKGVDTMNDAELLRDYEIKIDEKDALPLDDDEYYIADLYGMEVYDENDNFIGEIKDIIFTGANDVYIVERDDDKDLLLPAIKQCILAVNVKDNKMTVHVMEGL